MGKDNKTVIYNLGGDRNQDIYVLKRIELPFSEKVCELLFEIYYRMKDEYLTEFVIEDDFYYRDWTPFLFEYVSFNRERIRQAMDNDKSYSRKYEEYVKWANENHEDYAEYITRYEECNFAAYVKFLLDNEGERYKELEYLKDDLENYFEGTYYNSFIEFLECLATNIENYYFNGEEEEQITEEEYDENYGDFNHWHDVIIWSMNTASKEEISNYDYFDLHNMYMYPGETAEESKSVFRYFVDSECGY